MLTSGAVIAADGLYKRDVFSMYMMVEASDEDEAAHTDTGM